MVESGVRFVEIPVYLALKVALVFFELSVREFCGVSHENGDLAVV